MADGITNVVYNVTKELAKRGHQVDVYTSDSLDLRGQRSILDGNKLVNGVRVHYFRSWFRHKTFMFTPSMLSELLKNMKNYDIIHIHDARSFQGIATFLLKKIRNVPYVFQPHGSFLSQMPEAFSEKIIRALLDTLVGQRIVRGSSNIIALNQAEAKQYFDSGIAENKIVIIPNGIDLKEYGERPSNEDFREKYEIPSEKQMILYLGRIHKTKRIDLLIMAYAFMIKNLGIENTILVLAGPDDGYLTRTKSLARSLQIPDAVKFIGYVNDKDKMEAMADADLFATPSFHGFPITFLEACFAGTPIITTTLGDELEWIDGHIGYVTSPSYVAMAKAMYRILSDSSIAQVFSDNGKSIVRSQFSLERVVDQLEELYAKVAGRMQDRIYHNRISPELRCKN